MRNGILGQIEKFREALSLEEKSKGTIEKYMRDIRGLVEYLNGEELSKETLITYKKYLGEQYALVTANSKIIAINRFLEFIGEAEWRLKPFRVQKQIFLRKEKELTKEEYIRLVRTAEQQGKHRLAMILQTICATGIRISELQYITAEAVYTGRAEVNCKGKQRVIFIPQKLKSILTRYMRSQNIRKGNIFVTKNGKPLDRTNIWAEMKKLCEKAQVSRGKVFPHNLRHLFARMFYSMEKDVVKLADVLGHSSIETTRIYIMESGEEHRKRIEKMNLIVSG